MTDDYLDPLQAAIMAPYGDPRRPKPRAPTNTRRQLPPSQLLMAGAPPEAALQQAAAPTLSAVPAPAPLTPVSVSELPAITAHDVPTADHVSAAQHASSFEIVDLPPTQNAPAKRANVFDQFDIVEPPQGGWKVLDTPKASGWKVLPDAPAAEHAPTTAVASAQAPSTAPKMHHMVCRFGVHYDIPEEKFANIDKNAGNALRVELQGLTLGAGDELEAAARHYIGGEDYDAALKKARDGVAAGRELPGATALEFAGGAALPVPAFSTIAKGASFAGKVGRSILKGAGMGGVAGFAGSEGSSDPNATLGDHVAARLPGAAGGATAGAVVGGVLPVAGAAGDAILQGIKARVGIGNQQFARQAVADALRREAANSGSTSTDVLRRIEENGQSLALSNTPEIRTLAHQAAERSPVARRAFTDAIVNAEGGAGRRIEQTLVDALGPQDANEAAYYLGQARADNASRLYGDLFEQNSVHDMSGVLDASRPTVRAAINRANRWLADQGGLAINDVSRMTPRQIDYVGRALNDAADTAVRSGAGAHGTHLGKVRDAFYRAADRVLPGYRETRGVYHSDSDAIRALEAGRAADLRDGAATAQLVDNMMMAEPESREQMRRGIIQRLLDDTRNAPNQANRVRRVAETPAKLQNMQDTLGRLEDEMGGIRPSRADLREAVPEAFVREARGIEGAQALRQGLPDYEGGIRAALKGIDPASLAWSPKYGLFKLLSRYSLDQMNPRRAALVSQLLTGDPNAALNIARSYLSEPARSWQAQALANGLTATGTEYAAGQ